MNKNTLTGFPMPEPAPADIVAERLAASGQLNVTDTPATETAGGQGENVVVDGSGNPDPSAPTTSNAGSPEDPKP